MHDSKTVMIVDDDAIFSILMAGHLQRRGYRTAVEDGLGEVVPRVLAEQPDAVLLDVWLPGRNGVDICRELRSCYCGVILMVTASQSDLDLLSGLELGADGYLLKPVSPEVASAHLGACLRRHDRAAELHGQVRLQ